MEARRPVTSRDNRWGAQDHWDSPETPQDRKVIDTLEAEKLYYEGKTDLQISEALGVSVRSAQMWRYRRGLPPNRVKKIMDKQRAEIMYNQGKDDKQVADALEVNQIADGHPTLKGRVCFGPSADFSGS